MHLTTLKVTLDFLHDIYSTSKFILEPSWQSPLLGHKPRTTKGLIKRGEIVWSSEWFCRKMCTIGDIEIQTKYDLGFIFESILFNIYVNV